MVGDEAGKVIIGWILESFVYLAMDFSLGNGESHYWILSM